MYKLDTFKSNVRETWRVILVSEADIFLSESLRILAERLSQSRRLPLLQVVSNRKWMKKRKKCYGFKWLR